MMTDKHLQLASAINALIDTHYPAADEWTPQDQEAAITLALHTRGVARRTASLSTQQREQTMAKGIDLPPIVAAVDPDSHHAHAQLHKLADGTLYTGLCDLATEWEQRARARAVQSQRDPDEYGRRFIFHGALILLNNATQLRRLIHPQA